MTRTQATTVGFCAVLLWSLLALLTISTGPVPPFQLNAMCFAIATGVGLVWAAHTGGVMQVVRLSWKTCAFGTLGLFGFHFFYFSALRLAPTAETGLIAYLWPLLIVLFSGLLPGERLRAGHVIGGLAGFAGAGLIILRGSGGADPGALSGYGFAVLSALTWSGYSVLSRRLQQTPTSSVVAFCALSAILSALAHMAFEETAWPGSIGEWLCVLALGLGPAGLAFYVWDIGMKHGNIQLLGVLSYSAPLLSTSFLVLFGIAEATLALVVAAFLIAGGAALAARADTGQVRVAEPVAAEVRKRPRP